MAELDNNQQRPFSPPQNRGPLRRNLGVPVTANSNVDALQRSQAGAGSAGTTLGDSSGTGVNTPSPTTPPASETNLTQTSNRFAEGQREFATQVSEEGRQAGLGAINTLNRALRRGNISARSYGSTVGSLINNLGDAGAGRVGDIARAETASNQLESQQEEGRLGRLQQLRELITNTTSRENIANQELSTRVSEGLADRSLQRDLGTENNTLRAAQLAQQAEQNQASNQLARDQLGVQEAGQQQTAAFRENQLALQRDQLGQGAIEAERASAAQLAELSQRFGIDRVRAASEILDSNASNIPAESRQMLLEMLLNQGN